MFRAAAVVASAFLSAGLVLGPSASAQEEMDTELRTVEERSDFTRTATSAEVVELVEALADASERVVRESLGTSHEGRDLPLLLVADPPVESLDALRAERDRLVVLLVGNIHAGEVCGKAALLMLARELALEEEQPAALEDVVLVIVPNLNPDGNDVFAPDNRPGQVGPEEMGTRSNAQALDLNRDHVKLDSPEIRALQRLLRRVDPEIVVDTHTTNGSHHRYTITYQGPKHPAGDGELIAYVRDDLLPAVDDAFTEATGYEAFFYGNFAEGHSIWRTYPAEPRYGTAYRGLRNRISILSEAYSYAPFEDRVRGTLGFCRAVVEHAATRKKEIRSAIDDADERTVEAGRSPGEAAPLALRVEARTFDAPVTALGYEAYDEAGAPLAAPGAPRDWEVLLENDFVATLAVPRPAAYVLPPELGEIARMLQRHGVRVEELREEVEVDVERLRIDGWHRAERVYQGHRRIEDVAATRIPGSARLAPGSFVVPMDQPLGSLAGYLLEPQATDGLVAWNAFDAHLERGADLPVLRLPERAPLLTRSARPLPEDADPPRPITIESLYGDEEERGHVRIGGSSPGWIEWVEDDPAHYLLWRDDRLWRVHAATGRADVTGATAEAIAQRLAALDAIDEDAAEAIARRSFARLRPDAPGAVFRHADDLYFAHADGSGCVRLTATPSVEENAALSPDARFVSFVRDDNLFVVDVQTQTERAITTEGTPSHRFGKASWVYYEEVFGRNWNASWWAPTSDRLLFLEFDDSAVPSFTIIDDVPAPQRSETVRYPKPGDPNPTVRVWLTTAAGARPQLVDLSAYDPGRFLVTQVAWAPDGASALVTVQDRAQTWMDLLHVRAADGSTTRIYRETTEAWVTPLDEPRFLAGGAFLVRSERDGWAHLYVHESTGEVRTRVTEGPWEVRRVHHVDEESGWVWLSGTKDGHIGSNLYRARLDGSAIERLTGARGTHRVRVNADGSMFVDTWSSVQEPGDTVLRSADGAPVRVLDTNPVHELDAWERGAVELVTIDSAKGVPLEGMLIFPVDFDPELVYPAWFSTYAGPHAPSVRDTWSGGRTWHHALAQMGMVVFVAEPYPASGKGAQSAWTCYRALGERQLEDIDELIAWLADRPYVDAARIGMNGHSFGGYMTAYAMTGTQRFAAGIAGAPVTDWRDYDSIYTERYMGTPQDNPEGYERTSVVERAKELHGRLLLLHGTMDDNVHMQNTLRLVSALQNADKSFELMVYPGSRHGIRGAHVRRLMADFIRRTVAQDGPRARPEETAPPPADAPGPTPTEAEEIAAPE